MGHILVHKSDDQVTGKTVVLSIHNKGGVFLGVIRWWAPWQRYVFEPSPSTVFDKSCLNDIIIALDRAKIMEQQPSASSALEVRV